MTDPSDSPPADDDPPETLTLDPDALDSGDNGTLAHLLAEEFRHETVSDSARQNLREGLLADDASLDDQLGRLQSTVSDLQAYVSRLEPILPDGDDPNENLQDLLDRLAELETTLSRADDDLDTMSDSREELDQSIADMTAEIETVADRRERLDSALADLDNTVDELADELDRLDDLDERAEAIEADLEAAAERCETLRAFNQDLQSALGNLGQ